MPILTLPNLVLSLIAIYLIHRLSQALPRYLRHRALKTQHACLPAPSTQVLSSLTLGLPFWLAQIRALKEHRLLPFLQSQFSSTGAHTLRFCVLGTEFVTTQDPENVRAVLVKDGGTWSIGRERIEEMGSYLGQGIFVNEGAAWKHSRELVRPCFERSVVSDVGLFERHVGRFFEKVGRKGVVDLQPALLDLSMDIATGMLFGRSTDTLLPEGGDRVKQFCEAFEYASQPFEREVFRKWGVLSLFVPERWDWEKKRHVRFMQEFVDRIIDAHLANEPEDRKYNLITALHAAQEPRPRIRSELLNILLAGRDTVASLLSNLVWELSRHEDVFSTLRAEIDATLGSATRPTYDQLKGLKYLRAVVNETQRLYPIVPINSRQATTDTILPRGGGASGTSPVLIPKGGYVFWNMYAMQRCADIFGPDADEFRPERWFEADFKPGWAFIPFSGGPRACVGQGFALVEVGFVVCCLVRGWELERGDWGEWREKVSITCTGAGGCRVGLTPRVGKAVELG